MDDRENPAGRWPTLSLPHPQVFAESGGLRGDALVSVTGKGDPAARIDGSAFPLGVLRISFDDVPCPEWTDARGRRWRGPSEADVSEVLAFARGVRETVGDRQAVLPVHCLHGKSRSAALALAIMADSLGPGREAEAVASLLSGTSAAAPPRDEALAQMACNPGIVRFADRLLGRDGAIERALAEAMPRFVTWRAYWEARGCL